MKLQIKFKTVPVFHWNDQSELSESEVMRRVEERRSNMEFYWDESVWQHDMVDMFIRESPIAALISNSQYKSHTHNCNGDELNISMVYEVTARFDESQVVSKLNELSEYVMDYLKYQLPFFDLGLDTGILSNPNENGDEFWVGVTCDPNNTQCTIEIAEE